MIKNWAAASIIFCLAAFIFVGSGCLPSDYNLRAIRDSRNYIQTESAVEIENQNSELDWTTPAWVAAHVRNWSSASVIITNVNNTIGDTVRASWISDIISDGFEGIIFVDMDFDYLPRSWGNATVGTFEKTYYDLVYSNRFSMLMWDEGGELLLQVDNKYVLDPSAFDDTWRFTLLTSFESFVGKLLDTFPAGSNVGIGVLLNNYNSKVWTPAVDDTSIISWIDPYSVGHAYDEYTSGELGNFDAYQDSLITAFKDEGYYTLSAGNRLTEDDAADESLLASKKLDGVFIDDVTPINADTKLIEAAFYREAFTPADTSETILLIAGITGSEYNTVGGSAVYGLMIKKILDAGLYFTPGGVDSYFDYPTNAPGNWWKRTNEDSIWENDPNNPVYASITVHPRKIYNVALTPVASEADIFPPTISLYELAAYDSSGAEGAIRAYLEVVSNDETATYEFEHATSVSGPYTAETVAGSGTTIAEWIDTDRQPFNGTLYAKIRATDSEGNATGWLSRSIDIIREVGGDEDAPVISDVDIDIAYGANGDPITLDIDASTDELAVITIETQYVSSYPYYDTPAMARYDWVTAANDTNEIRVSGYQTSIEDYSIEIGPRCYHTDTLRVYIQATDSNGNVSSKYEAFNGVLNVPYGDVPDQGTPSEYRVGNNHSGSLTPGDYVAISGGVATIEDWGKNDLQVVTPAFFYEGPSTPDGYDHWIDRVRAYPGSKNRAFVGFSSLTRVKETGGIYPWIDRHYARMEEMYASGDTLVYVHDYLGNLPDVIDGSLIDNVKVLNMASSTGIAATVDFIVNEFNHSENRRPDVGISIDVYETVGDYGLSGYKDYGGDGIPDEDYDTVNAFVYIADLDRDGVNFKNDDDDQIAHRNGRISLIQDLRTAMEATGNTHFIIGANSVSARSDSELLAEMDFLYMEDVQVPHVLGTGYEVYDGTSCYSPPAVSYFPYHRMFSESFIREYCDGIYYDGYNMQHLPNPTDFNSSVSNLVATMRDDIGGPWVFWEQEGSSTLATVPDPVYTEVLALMEDKVYPGYIHPGLNWRRQWYHPSEVGYSSLSGLGDATEVMQREEYNSIYDHWFRTFDNGSAHILIKNLDNFDDEHYEYEDGVWVAHWDSTYVDWYDYLVVVGTDTLRKSANWYSVYDTDIIPPVVTDFNMESFDAGGLAGGLRIKVVGSCDDEDANWDFEYSPNLAGPWTMFRLTSIGTDIDEWVDTQELCYENAIYGKLSAIDASGNRSDKLLDFDTIDFCAPSAPTNLVASQYPEFLLLNWDDNSELDFDHYSVWRGLDSGKFDEIASEIFTTSYFDTTVAINTKYYYAIKAVDDDSNASSYSNIVNEMITIDLGDVDPPAVPTGLVATSGDTEVSLDWTSNEEEDFTYYKVYVGTTSGSLTAVEASIVFSEYIVTGLTNDTPYYFAVTASDTANNESAKSSEVSETPEHVVDLELASTSASIDSLGTDDVIRLYCSVVPNDESFITAWWVLNDGEAQAIATTDTSIAAGDSLNFTIETDQTPVTDDVFSFKAYAVSDGDTSETITKSAIVERAPDGGN